MTPDELRECLEVLGWSQRQAALIAGYQEGFFRQYASGSRPIPDELASWLRLLVANVKGRTVMIPEIRSFENPPEFTAAELAQVREENERLRAEADRLDWIASWDCMTLECSTDGWSVKVAGVQFACMEPSPRSAIDAARASLARTAKENGN